MEADNHTPYSISVIPKGVRLRERSPAGFRWPSSCHYGRMVCFIFPLEYNLPHTCHDKAEESSPILVAGWLLQLSRLAKAVTCSHRRSKYNESRNLEDLSIEKLPCTRYPNALARVVESHEQQGPMCPMSESFTSSWHTTSNIVFTDSKVANTNRARKLLDAVC